MAKNPQIAKNPQETKIKYPQKALRHCRKIYNKLRNSESRNSHCSHAANRALLEIEQKFPDLGVLGILLKITRNCFKSELTQLRYLSRIG